MPKLKTYATLSAPSSTRTAGRSPTVTRVAGMDNIIMAGETIGANNNAGASAKWAAAVESAPPGTEIVQVQILFATEK